MLTVTDGTVSVSGSIPLIISLVAGAAIGEGLGIEAKIEKLGAHMQKFAGRGEGSGFADGFVKASIVVGIGAMWSRGV